jgi:predicted ester cyclase
MPAEENKAMIREFLHALNGKPKPAGVTHHYVAEVDEALRRHIVQYEIAFPGFELIAQDMLAIGSCVLVHLCMRGIHKGDLWSLPPAGMRIAPPLRPTHNGEFMGIPPTGRAIVLAMTVLFRISADRIVEHRMFYNEDDLLRQLGLSPGWPHSATDLGESCARHMLLWREFAQVQP